MNTTILQTFLEVAKQRSYTNAAKTLHLTQPAVYQQVKHLEHDVGCQLVYQSGKAVLLTSAGRAILEDATQILQRIEYMLHSRTQDLEGLRAGAVAVTCGTTPGQSVLPEAVGSLLRAFPDVRVQLTVQNGWEEMADSLLRLGYDAAVTTYFTADSRLRADVIAEDEFVVVSKTPLVESADKPIRARDLDPGLLVNYAPTLALRETIEHWAASDGLVFSSALELGSQLSVMGVVEGGFGYGLVSAMVVKPFRTSVWYARLTPPLRRPLYAVYPSQNPISPALVRLCAEVRSCLARTMSELSLSEPLVP